MKPVCFLLCFLLCVAGTRTAAASLAVPRPPESTLPLHERPESPWKQPREADVAGKDPDEGTLSGDTLTSGHGEGRHETAPALSPVTQTVAGVKAARAMKSAAVSVRDGSSGEVSFFTLSVPLSGFGTATALLPGRPLTLSQVAALYRPRSGFFFESPDVQGSEMRLMTITPSAPEIRMLSPYQTDDPREEVPLPPAGLLLAAGLTACLAAGKRSLFRTRSASPAL